MQNAAKRDFLKIFKILTLTHAQNIKTIFRKILDNKLNLKRRNSHLFQGFKLNLVLKFAKKSFSKDLKYFMHGLILSSLLLSFSSCSKYSPINNYEQKQKFVVGSNDIPLYPYLEIVDEESANFDTISGNIVISKYLAKNEIDEIHEFYKETLPQLGWNLSYSDSGKMIFKRDRDNLEILFEYGSKGLYIKFFITTF